MIQENLLPILLLMIVLTLSTIAIFSNAYSAWFKPSNYQDAFVNAYKRLPKWFPLRSHFIAYYSSSSFIPRARIIYTIMAVIWFSVSAFVIVYFVERYGK